MIILNELDGLCRLINFPLSEFAILSPVSSGLQDIEISISCSWLPMSASRIEPPTR